MQLANAMSTVANRVSGRHVSFLWLQGRMAVVIGGASVLLGAPVFSTVRAATPESGTVKVAVGAYPDGKTFTDCLRPLASTDLSTLRPDQQVTLASSLLRVIVTVDSMDYQKAVLRPTKVVDTSGKASNIAFRRLSYPIRWERNGSGTHSYAAVLRPLGECARAMK